MMGSVGRPDTIEIVEVGPRDGLQNEDTLISTAVKVALVQHALDAGVRRIEVASFVHPERVPQMADAEAVVAGLPNDDNATYIGLCLNTRGLLRALATREGGARGVDQIGCVTVASDAFGRRNQGQTIAESVAETRTMLKLARAEGIAAQATIAVAFGCPFEGEVAPSTVLAIAEDCLADGPVEIALADTIGVAVPAQVAALFERLRDVLPAHIKMRGHFHDTRNTGIANIWAAVGAGADTIDASLGGLGGCPFAPGAAGNVATEDAVYMFARSGIATGLDSARLLKASAWLAGVMGKTLPSKLAQAGGFP
ncbi:MAG: hydroxymethylglutaryl-CoA lyase [Pontixanthobacter sp.]